MPTGTRNLKYEEIKPGLVEILKELKGERILKF